MKFSVIVPVHNGGEDLGRCLLGITAGQRAPDELIVIDDGSTDGAAASVAAQGAQVLTVEAGPRGPAHARNVGAAAATGDVLVFVDADVVLHADALLRLEAVFAAQADVQAVFGSYDDTPTAPGLASRYKNLLHHHVHQHGDREAGTFWAGCGALRRDLFRAVGGFDERYRHPAIEDIELGVRLRAAGHRVWLCPEIQATHLKQWTLGSLWSTDIVDRAIPWAQLILRQGRLPSDLNLGWQSRLSALAAWIGLGSLAGLAGATAWSPASLLLSLASLVALNGELYSLFYRKGGGRFALGAIGLHATYLIYSSAIFAALLLRHKLQPGRERPHG